MSGGLLFDALEGMLTWVDEDQEQTLYTKLTAAALLGYYDQDDVMATEFAPFEDVAEAALEPTDRSNRTFFLVPKGNEEVTKRFNAPDAEEASAWIEAINSHLGAIPDVGGYTDYTVNQPMQAALQQDTYEQHEPSPSQPTSTVGHPNSAMAAPSVVARLQPSLEVPPPRTSSPPTATRQQQQPPSIPQSRPVNQGAAPTNTRGWDSPIVSGGANMPPPSAGSVRPTGSNVSGSVAQPAIRTTTVATYDEYRQGGAPANTYANTKDWVESNNQSQGDFRRQTSTGSLGYTNPNANGPTTAWLRNTTQSMSQQSFDRSHSRASAEGDNNNARWGGPQSTPVPRLPLAAGTGQQGAWTGASNSSRPPLQQQTPNAASQGLDSTAFEDLNADGGSSIIGRKRSGMFVSVPANPQLNRNVAPNLSAMWKEWKDPVGDIYVFHEPTGSLHVCRAGNDAFETVLEGTEDIPQEDLRYHPYFDQIVDTVCDINGRVVYNIQNYGNQRIEGEIVATSADVYRSDAVTTPRGQYSPSRKSRISALNPPPRQPQSGYEGRRVHHLEIGVGPSGDPSEALITHQVQPLAAQGLIWDSKTGKAIDPRDSTGTNPRGIGQSTLYKQWEHVRSMLMQGRYFKKHAVKSNAYSYRFVFLTGDNAYVVCVPTSEVMLNVHSSAQTFNTVADTIQYYGRDARAIALNTITRVTLGSEEDNIVRRKGYLKPENTFCIVTQTHAFILECSSSKEAKYFADAWTFFMYHSKPLNVQAQRTKAMRQPVTHGTRAGLAF